MIFLDAKVNGVEHPLTALVDCGATNNFVKESCCDGPLFGFDVKYHPDVKMVVRFADGKPRSSAKRTISLDCEYELEKTSYRSRDEFLVLQTDQKYDLILGMPWLKRHRPIMDWAQGVVSSMSHVHDSAVDSTSNPASERLHEPLVAGNVGVDSVDRTGTPVASEDGQVDAKMDQGIHTTSAVAFESPPGVHSIRAVDKRCKSALPSDCVRAQSKRSTSVVKTLVQFADCSTLREYMTPVSLRLGPP